MAKNNMQLGRIIKSLAYPTGWLMICSLLYTSIWDTQVDRDFAHLSPGLNSLENLVFFFLCFLFRLRIDRGMLFFLLGPLCSEAVELAEDVIELVSSVSSATSSSDSRSPRRGHGVCRKVGSCSLPSSSASFGTGPLLEPCGGEFSSLWSWSASDWFSIENDTIINTD